MIKKILILLYDEYSYMTEQNKINYIWIYNENFTQKVNDKTFYIQQTNVVIEIVFVFNCFCYYENFILNSTKINYIRYNSLLFID